MSPSESTLEQPSIAKQQPAPAGPRIVAIGASAGGLEALEALFGAVSERASGLSFIIIQHLMNEVRTHLPGLLGRITPLPVTILEDGTTLAGGQIYILPPGRAATIEDGHVRLSDPGPSPHASHPINRFFRSLAETAGAQAVVVILSGSGEDGADGAAAVAQAGGMVVVQDPHSAAFDSMPRAATNRVGDSAPQLSPDAIGEMLNQLSQYTGDEYAPVVQAWRAYKDIIQLLLDRHEVDFGAYKHGLLIRSMLRHPALGQPLSAEDYCQQLHASPDSSKSLYQDLLVGVTSFFRNEIAFLTLERNILPGLVREAQERGEVRVWIAGSATGEEAYSVAMLLDGANSSMPQRPTIRIFATDIDEGALEAAAAGFYHKDKLQTVPSSTKDKYFSKFDDSYQVIDRLRENIIFCRHNILEDPPYSDIDLICCRNLSIYFTTPAQKSLYGRLHLALRDGGYLFLGESEQPTGLEGEFETIRPANAHIFKKRSGGTHSTSFAVTEISRSLATRSYRYANREHQRSASRVPQDALDACLAKFMPPSFLVDQRGNLRHIFGDGGKYLSLTGAYSENLADMLPRALASPLRSTLAAASAAMVPQSRRRLAAALPGGQEILCDLELTPLLTPAGTRTEWILVVIADSISRANLTPFDGEGGLERELRASLIEAEQREQHLVEELGSHAEELASSNEELLSANEELQSSNEELQSLNEELHTVNGVYHRKLDELNQLSDDMANTLRGAQIGVVFIDAAHCLREITDTARRVLGLQQQDIGRPINQLRLLGQFREFEQLIQSVEDSNDMQEAEIRTGSGASYLLRALPARNDAKVANGTVVTVIDITDRMLIREQLRANEERLRRIFESASSGMIMIAPSGSIEMVNQQAETMFGYARSEMFGRPIECLIPARLRTAHRAHFQSYIDAPGARAMGAGRQLFGRRKDGSEIPVEINLSPIELGSTTGVLVSVNDVSMILNAKLEADRSLAQTRAVMEKAEVAIALYGPDHRLAWCTNAYRRLHGDAGEAITPGMPIADITQLSFAAGLTPAGMPDPATWQNYILDSRDKSPFRREQRALPDGRWHDIQIVTLDDGSVIGLRHDVSAIKQEQLRIERLMRSAGMVRITIDLRRRYVDAPDWFASELGLAGSRSRLSAWLARLQPSNRQHYRAARRRFFDGLEATLNVSCGGVEARMINVVVVRADERDPYLLDAGIGRPSGSGFFE